MCVRACVFVHVCVVWACMRECLTRIESEVLRKTLNINQQSRTHPPAPCVVFMNECHHCPGLKIKQNKISFHFLAEEGRCVWGEGERRGRQGAHLIAPHPLHLPSIVPVT